MGQVEAPVWGGAREDWAQLPRCTSLSSFSGLSAGAEGVLWGCPPSRGSLSPPLHFSSAPLLLLGSRGPVTPAHLGGEGREGEGGSWPHAPARVVPPRITLLGCPWGGARVCVWGVEGASFWLGPASGT